MKKIIIGIILIGLVSWGAWALLHDHGTQAPAPASEASSTPVEESSGTKTYADPAGRFTLTYLDTWQAAGAEANATTPTGWSEVTPGSGQVAAKLSVPKALYPQTNFSEAWLTVGSSNDPKAIAACEKNVQQEGMDVQSVTIQGRPFKRFETSDAAAGSRYDTVAYHAILDGDCWAIEYTIHSTNIYNYPPEAGIKEFDHAALEDELDASARSFDFLVNSD
jgi:hypothetical protein